MTKLSNNIQYCNDNLPIEFAEYLIANRFKAISIKDGLCFHKENLIKVFIRSNTVEVFKYEPDKEGMHWAFKQSHSGIGDLNFFAWVMLMHIMGALRVNEFIKNAKQENAQAVTEANFLVRNLLRFQHPNATFNA